MFSVLINNKHHELNYTVSGVLRHVYQKVWKSRRRWNRNPQKNI